MTKENKEEDTISSSGADETEPKQADNTSLSDVDNVNTGKDVVMKITRLTGVGFIPTGIGFSVTANLGRVCSEEHVFLEF